MRKSLSLLTTPSFYRGSAHHQAGGSPDRTTPNWRARCAASLTYFSTRRVRKRSCAARRFVTSEPSLEGAVAELRELLDGALEVWNRCGRVPLLEIRVAEAARGDRPLERVGRSTERPLARLDASLVLTDRGVDDSAHPGRERLELRVADVLADRVGATFGLERGLELPHLGVVQSDHPVGVAEPPSLACSLQQGNRLAAVLEALVRLARQHALDRQE